MTKCLIGYVVAATLVFFGPSLVFAQTNSGFNTTSGGGYNTTSGGGYNTTSGSANPSTGFTVVNPLSVQTICGLIQKLLAAFLALGTPVAVLFLVYAGALFVWARGNPAGLQKAKRNLLYVIIGIAIFLGAWLLGQVIANTINAIQPGTVSGGQCN